jgi:hypothetical protein
VIIDTLADRPSADCAVRSIVSSRGVAASEHMTTKPPLLLRWHTELQCLCGGPSTRDTFTLVHAAVSPACVLPKFSDLTLVRGTKPILAAFPVSLFAYGQITEVRERHTAGRAHAEGIELRWEIMMQLVPSASHWPYVVWDILDAVLGEMVAFAAFEIWALRNAEHVLRHLCWIQHGVPTFKFGAEITLQVATVGRGLSNVLRQPIRAFMHHSMVEGVATAKVRARPEIIGVPHAIPALCSCQMPGEALTCHPCT